MYIAPSGDERHEPPRVMAESSTTIGLGDARPLVFMHIPKTAGTALVRGLHDTVQPLRPLGGFDLSMFGDFSDFSDADVRFRDRIHRHPASIPTDADFVAGHMALSSLRRQYPTGHFITLLREPHARLLSHWLFWRQQTDRDLALWGRWGERVRQAREPLESFLALRNIACQTDNVALRMLLWPHELIPNDGFIDPVHDGPLLDAAIQALGYFGFARIIEDPDIADALSAWLGRPFSLGRSNETGVPPAGFRTALHRELSAEACRLVDQRSRLDRALWRHVGRRHLTRDQLRMARNQALLAGAARFAMIATGAGVAGDPPTLGARTAAAAHQFLKCLRASPRRLVNRLSRPAITADQARGAAANPATGCGV